MRSTKLWSLAAVAWLVLGVGLVADGALDTIKWQSDPAFARVGLTWNWIGMGAGAVALVLGTWWLVRPRTVAWFGYLVAGLFSLYTLSYLIFGGEGALIYRVALPLSVLALSVVTIWWLWRNRVGSVG